MGISGLRQMGETRWRAGIPVEGEGTVADKSRWLFMTVKEDGSIIPCIPQIAPVCPPHLSTFSTVYPHISAIYPQLERVTSAVAAVCGAYGGMGIAGLQRAERVSAGIGRDATACIPRRQRPVSGCREDRGSRTMRGALMMG